MVSDLKESNLNKFFTSARSPWAKAQGYEQRPLKGALSPVYRA